MNHSLLIRFGLVGAAVALLALRSTTVQSDTVFFAGTPPTIAQDPLYLKDAVPPLNMLIMGKDHKIYYEAYNDASDLNGDGALDVGYKPGDIEYYGYFNSNVCYVYESTNGGRFVPSSAATNKQCSGKWSGDFLNYLTTSRMDALRRVLYGGWRETDTATDTTLQGAFFPQDAHSWGKEYQGVDRDGYDISNYAPLGAPDDGNYHLFAVTTVTGNDAAFPNYEAPLFRVMQNSEFRIWNWLSMEGPVANNKCFNDNNQRVDCIGTADAPFPGHPGSRAAFDTMETTYAVAANQYGSGTVGRIDCNNNNCNPHGDDDNYLTIFTGQISIRGGRGGTYQFRVNGDDVIDFVLTRTNGTEIAAIGCYTTGGRGFGACGGNETSPGVALAGNTLYNFEFRHEEGGGGDGYLLEWRKTSGGNEFGWRAITTNANGDANGNGDLTDGTTRTTYDLTPPQTGGSSRTDYNVRVQVCPGGSLAALQDSTCKTYPGGNAKPTGILHDYGENQKMYFGLITGSQFNNLEGGVLRRNISNFADEINVSDGTFKSGTGIVNALSRLRMIGGGYNGSTTNNLNSDTNWNWANDNGNCPSVGDRAINNGECRMWGNPIAEMMFEGMRYFAGAAAPTTRFATGGVDVGRTEETDMGLSQETWKDPYAATGGYPSCARPYQTIISDINPSYDGDLPGSAFATVAADPAAPGFDAAGQGQTIWNNEFGAGAQPVFIGEVAGATDGAPTAKMASSFGNIRGLAPEEPTKGGTYYAASVARYGYVNDLNVADEMQKLGIYSIALASPLPRIEFPVGGRVVTLLPFAKTVSGTFGGGTRKPTNTIVDFYVEQIVNLPGGLQDPDVNGGRPYAVFRINYEDVEQGNDHDMDAIVRYEVVANADNTVGVNLTSEYAAGSADQNIGYVISGTTRDGIYLEVRDRDGPGTPYRLNTPPGTWAGDCEAGVTTFPCNQALGLTGNRTFTPSVSAPLATELHNPLWYAAKYGGFNDADGDGLPDAGEWDSNTAGEPDNYFLVTNPLELRSQLSKAFDSIANSDLDVGVATISGARVGNSSFTLQPTFVRGRNGKDWTGNLSAIAVNPNGMLGNTLWTAQAELPAAASRKIHTITAPGDGTASTRTAVKLEAATPTNLGATTNDQYAALGINPATITTQYGAAYTPTQFIAYLTGDQSNEASVGGAGNTLRTRSAVLGDIINSEPVVVSARANYGYGYYGDSMFDGYAGSGGYLEDKADRKTLAFVGANDGMLHAFDASTQPCPAPDTNLTCKAADAGEELFAFVPHGVLNQLGQLALPDNNFNHRYYVDGQITVGDAKDGATWKTLLVGSTGAGGRSVFALDVSDADSFGNNDVLWERNAAVDLDIGHVYGKPMLVPLENDEWGVLFGNGYGGNTSDPSLYILDAFTGELIRKITADDGNPASTGPLTPVADFICSAISAVVPYNPACARTVDPFNGLGQITAIDKSGNGKVDTVYGGDLQGNLWKFDLGDGNDSNWDVAYSGDPLFTAETGTEAQPITGGIRVAAGPGTGVMVYFGTGRYFVTGDNDVPAAPQVQALYAVFDDFLSAAGGRSALAEQTIMDQVTTVDDRGTADTSDDITYISRNISRTPVSYYGASAKRGWYVDLKLVTATDGSGERFIATPLIRSGRVFFATFTPTENSCNPGGTNYQYGLDLLSGAGTLSNIKVLPNDSPACTGANCGAVMINNGGAPIMSSGAAAINPLTQIDDTCDPTTESCATFEQCQVVIYPGGFVLPRPCGRQSWRQLK